MYLKKSAFWTLRAWPRCENPPKPYHGPFVDHRLLPATTKSTEFCSSGWKKTPAWCCLTTSPDPSLPAPSVLRCPIPLLAVGQPPGLVHQPVLLAWSKPPYISLIIGLLKGPLKRNILQFCFDTSCLPVQLVETFASMWHLIFTISIKITVKYVAFLSDSSPQIQPSFLVRFSPPSLFLCACSVVLVDHSWFSIPWRCLSNGNLPLWASRPWVNLSFSQKRLA